MHAYLTPLLILTSVGVLGSCAPKNDRLESTLKRLTDEQKALATSLEAMTRRLGVLEARLGEPGSVPGRVAGKPAGRPVRELAPDELPKVTLRPPEPRRAPPPTSAPPPPETEEEVVSVAEPGPPPEEDEEEAPSPPGSKRVVLRLQGEPPGAGPTTSPGGPVLPLGRHATLKEPEESEHHPTTKAPDKAPARPAETRPASGAEGLYALAMEHYEQARYALALTTFARVEKEHAGHALVANAVFWQGECHFQSGRYPLAIQQYQRLIDQHPKSAKAIDAMYKLGVSHEKNGNPARARELLSRVVELVPQTPTAIKAAAYLQKMR